MSETAFAWNLVSIVDIRLSAIVVAFASEISFAYPSVTAMPLAGAATVGCLGRPTAPPTAGDGTAVREVTRATDATNAIGARRMERDTTNRRSSPHARQWLQCSSGTRLATTSTPGRHFRRLATTLIERPMMTAPKRNASRAWRSAVLRIGLSPMSVSETWKVRPIVNARYAKSR